LQFTLTPVLISCQVLFEISIYCVHVFFSIFLLNCFFFITLVLLNIYLKFQITQTIYKSLNFIMIFMLIVLFVGLVNLILIYTPYSLSSHYSSFKITYFVYYLFPFAYIFIIITLLTLIFCILYNQTEVLNFSLLVTFIFITGLNLFWINSIILFFLLYECLLIPSFLILYNFAKTRKCVEAAYLMFFWTQFGAIFLFFNFIYLFMLTNTTNFENFVNFQFSNYQINFLTVTAVVGFGVKFPIWPFYDWLPKAHVEASTNFSIFLSGVLVKLAFFGFVKYLFYLENEFSFLYLYPFLFIGLVDSSLKLYYQLDLKKLIAYSTVIEMHWLLIAVMSGQSVMWLVVFFMLISHALISSNFFLLIDAVTRRFKTRLITEIRGLFFLTPKLYFIVLQLLLVFLGFPGSLFFITEFLFFSYLIDINAPLFFLTLLLLYFFVGVSFFKSWFFLLFGYSDWFMLKTNILDLDLKELIFFYFFIVLLFWLGITHQFFIF